MAVAELPASFEGVKAWVERLLDEHSHMLGLRGFLDLSRLISRDPPPTQYIDEFVAALRPLLGAARDTRCALLLPSQRLMRRARLLEALTRGSRIRFRAFDNRAEALAWLGMGA